ncbi:MAG: hypothetical protein Ct9H300mP16_18020 [Pseudomonadota bacterium]|nr:MAG: hypothetical protein Ct9H300mP16_18020 [Pseudomonadota bacterium]
MSASPQLTDRVMVFAPYPFSLWMGFAPVAGHRCGKVDIMMDYRGSVSLARWQAPAGHLAVVAWPPTSGLTHLLHGAVHGPVR